MLRLRLAVLGAASAFALTAAPVRAANPLLAPSSLPFGAPQFDHIADTDYQPALEEGMRRQMLEIRRIASNPAPPTFTNTIVQMELSGQLLARAEAVFGAVTAANTNDTLQQIEATEAPKLAAHHDAIYLNPALFRRVSSIYARRNSLHLNPEARQLVDVYYHEFVHSGANLSDADKAKLRDVNKQLSTLQTEFNRRLLAATKAGGLEIDDRSSLAGASETSIAAAAEAARMRGLAGKWFIPLQNTTQQPALSSLDDRATRQALYDRSWTRAEKGGDTGTRDTISTIAQLRAQKAQLLGFPNYAAYALTDEMAKTPATVQRFLAQLVQPVTAQAQSEAADIQAAIDASGQHFELQHWDWQYYADRVRKAKYDLNESEIRPYFELNNVLTNGLFYAANRLYGLTFTERKDLPVYQPDVRVFNVFDKDGSQLGLMYFDFFKRDNKSGGAWMDSFVEQSRLLGTKPVIYNVENFTKPAPGQPALLGYRDVTGMFHEFGHALHGFFANEEYPTLSGTNVARDFVEFPSQFNEHWALDPQVLKHYAFDYATGKPMPQELADKIQRSSKFGAGYAVGELLAADELDLQWHLLPASAPKQDVDTFETQALQKTHTAFANVPPRYRSSYFQHIWAGGYAAGYYAYMWSEMLDDDVYQWFEQHGGLTRANGQRLRDLILSRGHTEDYATMFRAFYGRDPDIGPLLEQRGLTPATPKGRQ